KGLIYEDEKTTNYCPVCQTTISDAEVDYEEEKTTLNYIKFRIKETGEDSIIATTRPELLCSCRIVIFNPEDERYQHLKGKHAVVPIYGHEVKIQPHPYAKPEFGSGLVMVCSFGDYSDVRLL
ncbi:MAG: class I tRNA ligase family protein, partial [Candidatus Bathyarchaeia archaeon]